MRLFMAPAAASERVVLRGPKKPEWSCSCGCDRNWASRTKCKGCGREAPRSILDKARKADKEAAKSSGGEADTAKAQLRNQVAKLKKELAAAKASDKGVPTDEADKRETESTPAEDAGIRAKEAELADVVKLCTAYPQSQVWITQRCVLQAELEEMRKAKRAGMSPDDRCRSITRRIDTVARKQKKTAAEIVLKDQQVRKLEKELAEATLEHDKLEAELDQLRAERAAIEQPPPRPDASQAPARTPLEFVAEFQTLLNAEVDDELAHPDVKEHATKMVPIFEQCRAMLAQLEQFRQTAAADTNRRKELLRSPDPCESIPKKPKVGEPGAATALSPATALAAAGLTAKERLLLGTGTAKASGAAGHAESPQQVRERPLVEVLEARRPQQSQVSAAQADAKA